MEEQIKSDTPAFEPPAGAVDISTDKDGGLWKEVKVEGTGSDGPLAGDTVTVHYVGKLLDGTQFDSSRDRGDKFEFELGKGSVIKGWDVGVATMRRGEVAMLTCSSEYAYGDAGSPPKIPPKATLVFEVELFEWKGEDVTEDKDGGVVKSTLKKGEGYKTPGSEALVKVKITGTYKDRKFEEREVEFINGDGEDVGVVEGVELAIGKMKSGEKAKLGVKSGYAYAAVGDKDKGIPPYADLTYDVELVSFENMKEAYELEEEEKLEQSELVKQKGTKLFKEGKYKRAKVCYDKIVNYLKPEELSGEMKQRREALLLAAYLNLAMCSIKLNDYAEALKHCESALELDEKNEKALFRRGLVHMDMANYDEAMLDFQEVLALAPENKAAKNKMLMAQHKVKEYHSREKKIFGGMFDKFAKIDAAKEPEIKPDDHGDAVDENSTGEGESIETDKGETVETA